MKTLRNVLLIALLIGIAFAAGRQTSRPSATGKQAAAARPRVYACPMHPQYRSDHASDCMACGMRMEPVDDDDQSTKAHMPGTIQVSAEKQQAIGVRLATATRSDASTTVRTIGRVAVDENRSHRIAMGVAGWVQRVMPVTTGAVVRKGDALAWFYSAELLTAQQQYVFSYVQPSVPRLSVQPFSAQPDNAGARAMAALENMQSLGMTPEQVHRLVKSGKPMRSLDIRAPVDGIVLARSTYVGQQFERGTELYRIVDLSSVWVVAEVFAEDARSMRPGRPVQVALPGQSRAFRAVVSAAPPEFDVASRTYRVRLEVSNPDYALRPDMLVDVSIPQSLPAAVTVPVDAVVGAGMHRAVFVARGGGFFEQRPVQTSWRHGGRVAIVSGVSAGEKVVVAGNFLLDSESRLRATQAGAPAPETQGGSDISRAPAHSGGATAHYPSGTDPVCGMQVGADHAVGDARYGGKQYVFCSTGCKTMFDAAPTRYVGAGARKQAPSGDRDPVCGAPIAPNGHPEESTFRGVTYHFCSLHCKCMFDAAPGEYARRKPAGASASAAPVEMPRPDRDPVCGMTVAPGHAAGESRHAGKVYRFCSAACKRTFDASPAKYANASAPASGMDGMERAHDR